MQLGPHGEHGGAQPVEVARLRQHALADGFEARAHGGVAAAVARTRQRLVFPGPGLARLVLGEGVDAADQQAGGAIRAQAQVGVVQRAGGGVRAHPGDQALAQPGIDFLRGRMRVVVQEHQVQIGGIAKFLAAELAVGDDRERRPLAVAPGQAGPHQVERGLHQQVGQRGELVGQFLHAPHAGQILRQQTEGLGVLEMAQFVHLTFDVAGMRGQAIAQFQTCARPVRWRHELAMVEQFVEQVRLAGQILRRPRAGGHETHELAQRLRVFLEQGQVGDAARDGLQQRQHPPQRVARVGQRRDHFDQRRQQPVQRLLVGRRQAGVTRTLAEACEQGQRLVRLDVAGQRQAVARIGSRQIAQAGQRMRRLILLRRAEHLFELAGHPAPQGLQTRQQAGPVGAAHGTGHTRAVLVVAGQPLRLRIVQILQAMLQVAQEHVRFLQRRGLGFRQQIIGGELVQQGARRPHAQRGFLAAADELEHLGDELDLADAARAQLDVVGHVLARHLAADLLVQLTHGAEHAEVDVFAEHERHAQPFQFVDARRLAGDRPALDPGVAFPFARLGIEVILQHGQAGHQWTGIAVGPQAHVDAEHVTVRGGLVQRQDQAPAQAAEKLEIADAARPGSLAVLRVDEDQVDVGRGVELAATQLAHGHHHHALRPAGGVERLAMHPGKLAVQAVERRAHTQFGQLGQRARDLGEVRQSVQIARHDQREHPFAQTAQKCPQRGIVAAGIAQPGRQMRPFARRGQVFRQPFAQRRRGVEATAQPAAVGGGMFDQVQRFGGRHGAAPAICQNGGSGLILPLPWGRKRFIHPSAV